ncbi:MAG: Gfo/Idh/MocA family oxidoreductase, partial [bacterium]|nr:Gfo/Idh/MocA family oxidoreductase [bacterium]
MPLANIVSMTRRSIIAGAGVAAAQSQMPAIRLPRKVRVGLIGLDGHTGEILRPLPRLPDVQLVAVADPNAKRVARLADNSRYQGLRTYTDYRQMLEAETLDLAGVCTPNGDRAQAILACVARKLHVVAEKPLALSAQDLHRIQEAVSEHGIRLTTMLPMRFSSPYLAMREIVERGEVGEVVQVAAQKSYKAGNRPAWMRNRESYGGTIPWIGIHMIDLMRHISRREFTEVFSIASHIGFPQLGDMENVTTSVFGLDNGGIATLRMDYLRPETAPSHGDDRLRIAGTEGIVEYMAATGVTFMTASSPPRQVEQLPASRSLFVDFL